MPLHKIVSQFVCSWICALLLVSCGGGSSDDPITIRSAESNSSNQDPSLRQQVLAAAVSTGPNGAVTISYSGSGFEPCPTGTPLARCLAGSVTWSFTFGPEVVPGFTASSATPVSGSMSAAGSTVTMGPNASVIAHNFSFANGKVTSFQVWLSDSHISIRSKWNLSDPKKPSGFDEAITTTTPNQQGSTTAFGSLSGSNGDSSKNLGAACVCSGVGNPINSGTGNKFQIESDFAADPHTLIGLTRYYNSRDDTITSFGMGWRSEWQRSLAVNAVSGIVKVATEDGKTLSFVKDSTGNWITDADVTSVLASTGSGWVLTREDDSVEAYSVTGQLVSVTTRAGLVTRLNYDASHHLSMVTGPFGQTLTFTYANNHVSQMKVPDGGIYQYAYDVNNNLVSVTYPGGAIRKYVYDNPKFRNALTGIIDELGVRFATYAYDATGNAISTQHAGGVGLVKVAYNADGSSTITDARGNVHTSSFGMQYGLTKPIAMTGAIYPQSGAAAYAYDGNGFVASMKDWNGNTTSFTHDARGNETVRTEADGSAVARTTRSTWLATFHLPSKVVTPTLTLSFSYDAKGNVLTRTETATNGTARTSTFTYNAAGQVLTAVNPRLAKTVFAYDTKGNLVSVTDPVGNKTQIGPYDANGRPLTAVDPNGLKTTMSYDPLGRLLTRNAGGQVTSFAYDKAGNLVTRTEPSGAKLTMLYDAAHRLVQLTDSLGNRTKYTLDANSNLTNESVYTAAGALSRTVSYAYDAANRLVLTSHLHGTTTLARDNNGNVVKTTDGLGWATSVAYDALNRQTSSTDPNGGVTSIKYDAGDRIVSVTDPRKLATTYTYNGFGDRVLTRSPDSGATNDVVDVLGNVTSSTDARGSKYTVTRVYDLLDRLTSVTSSAGTLSYQYNSAGQLAQIQGPTDATQFGYDALGHLISKQQTISGSTLTQHFAYDAAGRLSGITYPSGMTVAYQYDAAGQTAGLSVNGGAFLNSVQHEPFGAAKGWAWYGQNYVRTHDLDGRIASYSLGSTTRALSYDNAGDITRLLDATGTQQAFGYDKLKRLTQYSTPALQESFAYDATGNRTALTKAGATTGYTIATNSNRMIAQTGPAATDVYDAAGNLTSNGTLTFTYDALGRMTASGTGAAQANRTNYATNAVGQRVLKSGPNGSTTFLYDIGSRLLGEYGSSKSQETIYLDGQPVGVFNNGQLYRVFADHLGSPRVIQTTAGATVWQWDGDPFGDVVPSGSLGFQQRFPGQYHDGETGLNYNMARYYDPKSARYVEGDPIGLRGGINNFAYAGSNPVSNSDRFGLFPWSGETQCHFGDRPPEPPALDPGSIPHTTADQTLIDNQREQGNNLGSGLTRVGTEGSTLEELTKQALPSQ